MNKVNNEKQSSGFNWGTGITVAIILFISITLGVVGYLVSLDYQMVAPNYYKKAKNYQQHIDRVELTNTLSEPVKIEFADDEQKIAIRFPSSINHKDVSGTIELYRPGNSRLDQTIKLLLDDKNVQHIDTINLATGKWVVKVSWSSDDKNYYQEKSIFL
jgi:hypothetical protein